MLMLRFSANAPSSFSSSYPFCCLLFSASPVVSSARAPIIAGNAVRAMGVSGGGVGGGGRGGFKARRQAAPLLLNAPRGTSPNSKSNEVPRRKTEATRIGSSYLGQVHKHTRYCTSVTRHLKQPPKLRRLCIVSYQDIRTVAPHRTVYSYIYRTSTPLLVQ